MNIFGKLSLTLACASSIVLGSAIYTPSLAFGILPIKVYFERAFSSRDVTLDNAEDSTVRLKVSIFKWEEDGNGKRELTPTKDISLFPAILELKPKSKRIIRLSSKLPPKEFEQTYRLFVEQLPETVVKKPEETPDGVKPKKTTVKLNFLYTLDLPVFINPTNIQRKSAIVNSSISGNKLSFDLINKGNAHVFASIIEAKIKDSSGKIIGTGKYNPTYVLPPIQRKITIDLPQEQCQNAKTISLEISGDEDMGDRTKLSETIPTPKGVCLVKK
jgi:fimbrial chaperone protein